MKGRSACLCAVEYLIPFSICAGNLLSPLTTHSKQIFTALYCKQCFSSSFGRVSCCFLVDTTLLLTSIMYLDIENRPDHRKCFRLTLSNWKHDKNWPVTTEFFPSFEKSNSTFMSLTLSLASKNFSHFSTSFEYMRNQGLETPSLQMTFWLYPLFIAALQLRSSAVCEDGCASWISLHSATFSHVSSVKLSFYPLFCGVNTIRWNISQFWQWTRDVEEPNI